jgi:electron transfer flavoprotein alpha subunit
MSGVLVITEQRAGAWNRMSWETLAAGQQLAAQLGVSASAVAIGGLADELAAKKLERVYAVQHDLLRTYTADGYTAALEQLVRKINPSLVLFPHTYQVRDFAPKLATRFGQVLISDAIGFRVESGSPIFVRQLFQGKLNADVKPGGPAPHFASIQAGAFRADQLEAGSAPVENFAPRNWPRRWAPNWQPRGPSVTAAGFRWSARWAVPAKPSRPKSIWPSEFPAPSSTW